MANLEFQKTSEKDLENVMRLWNDGEVMKFVGFPDGIGITMDALKAWLARLEAARPWVEHWSIYDEYGQYCGETHHNISRESDKPAALDIKLLPAVRGKGIAFAALSHAIDSAFALGANSVYVDPNRANEKALALYRRLGFREVPHPEDYEDDPGKSVYMVLDRVDLGANRIGER